MNILMVCLGNICRSPIAHGIMENKISQLRKNWLVDSAGISDWHEGEAPDHRAVAIARQYGIPIHEQKSRMISPEDFSTFDLILVADENVMTQLRRICPPNHLHKLHYMVPSTPEEPYTPVPDPYYGSMKDFEAVYQQLNVALEQWIEKLL